MPKGVYARKTVGEEVPGETVASALSRTEEGLPVEVTAPASPAPAGNSLSYVALKRMRIGEDFREIGAEVPEARTWRNAHNYVSAGYLAILGTKE